MSVIFMKRIILLCLYFFSNTMQAMEKGSPPETWQHYNTRRKEEAAAKIKILILEPDLTIDPKAYGKDPKPGLVIKPEYHELATKLVACDGLVTDWLSENESDY